jgi:hypothetical protein
MEIRIYSVAVSTVQPEGMPLASFDHEAVGALTNVPVALTLDNQSKVPLEDPILVVARHLT